MVVGEMILDTDVVVIGGGPGGYVAAARAADLGKSVVLIEKREKLGGVCLIEGCIPSKTLIHAVEVADEFRNSDKLGIKHDGISFDLPTLRDWTSSVVNQLTSGVDTLITKRDIDVVRGHARFVDKNKLHVEGANAYIQFKNAIIATGSRINELPGDYDLPLWSSAEALTLPEIPEKLLVVGGGYIGMEMGLVYAGLGSNVTMVEFLPGLLAGADPDLVNVVVKKVKKRFAAVHTDSKVVGVEKSDNGYTVEIEHEGKTFKEDFNQVLVAIGRKPNTEDIGLDKIGIKVDKMGLIETNEECRTSVNNVFAIGDVTHGPALAHKASREGKVAAEVIAGQPSAFDNVAVPAVIFTDPEIAWTGLTEREAEEKGIQIKVGRFPLTALGRAKTIGKTEGFVKVLIDPETELVLGVGIVGQHASELIAEGNLAIEMGATVEDLIVSIHPHPTFSESIMEAAEVAAGGAVHLLPKKK
jgi:dihydrolipoamide dehydrogenase